jgi:DNA repair protein RAD50
MSSLLCMNIRGVRSFASDTEQRIEFFKPLTVIVGPNGCGKTSTIECLRYATTGNLPPGAQSGRAFVHDPKVEGENEVKASVKLLFDTADKSKRYMAIRNMQLTQKKKQAQFKQIDGVLRAIDLRKKNNNKSEITQKCAQLNDIIPSLLGISRAVLDNVIFCHQEDSCWPLKEGSELKKRFDDIFESTRYTKALEEIIKQKKIQTANSKEYMNALAISKGKW